LTNRLLLSDNGPLFFDKISSTQSIVKFPAQWAENS